jgi:two-component system, LuxR family, sensor kinase FixL
MKTDVDAVMSTSQPSSAGRPAEIVGDLHGRMLQVARLATIGEMAAGVAHELNQPLTAIALYAQACERLLAGPEPKLPEIQSALRQIAAEAVRAGQIISRLRGLARNHKMEQTPTAINSLVTEIAELMRSDARARDVRLRLELAENLPAVAVDREHIQHVILNLVRNGVQALEESPIRTRDLLIQTRLTEDGEIELSVSDNGPGPDPAVIERMFDPFFSTKESGTGLGLPISNTIVRANGGTLSYRPNEPSGACFYICFPLNESPRLKSSA